MLGKRPALLALALARVVIASAVLLQGRHVTVPGVAFYTIQGIVFSLAALGLAGFFLNLPRTRGQFLALLLLDWVFAGCIILLGAPVTGLLLLFFDEIALRVSGWRWSPLIAIAPLLAVLAGLWWADTVLHVSWIDLQILPTDVVVWAVILLLYAVTSHFTAQRRASLERLGDDIWIDPILASNQPFSYDFTKWIQQLSSLFGGERCVCMLALSRKNGAARIFSSGPVERFQAELTKALGVLRDLPGTLAVVRDRERADAASADDAIHQLHLLSLLDQGVIMAKPFELGRQSGLLILAHDQPNDAVLAQEARVIDQALDGAIERINQTMEMRRAFLTEAREVARRDLHDGVLQSLAALRMRLLTIIQSQELVPAANAEIRNTAEIIALEQARLRSLLDENVDADQPVNLLEALRLCVKTTALQWEIEVEFVSDEAAIPMHRESANNVEYLLREVVANAARHSGSKELRCSLALRDNNLIISLMDLSSTPATLSDDFHTGPLSSHSLRQRLSLVNGRAYSDGLQTGTLLAIAIPLTYDEADL